MRDFHGPGRSAVYAENGMCATSHPLAAQLAVEILRSGGNAVDAAIAGSLLLGLCEPAMTGLGGDCFALVKPAGSEDIIALNGSGRAPAALSAEAIRAAGHSHMPLFGAPEPITIPGAVDAFCLLSRDHGRLGLDAVLAPVIAYAEAGVPVAPRAAFDWMHHEGNLSGRARDTYLVDGAPPCPGQRFRHPGQAEVLRRIAAEGRAGFYEGEVAEDMVASLRALGGGHTLDDFAATACDYVEPMRVDYRGHELIELPPNGQGPTALLMARLMSRFALAELDPLGAERAHLEAEIAKIAYDARNRFIADPGFGPLAIEHMLADDTVDALAALIDPARAMTQVHRQTSAVHRDTVYLCVVDRDRMAVSLIYSIFHAFGSGLCSDRFGINFQNRGAGLNLVAGHPNELAPRKRPMHTLIPGMLRKRGEYLMPFGVMGGQYQAAGHARLISNLIDFDMDLQSAMDAPRSFPEPDTGDLTVEWGYADGVVTRLGEIGHRVVRPEVGIGGSQAIRVDLRSGVLCAASDPRKDGLALGA